MGNISDRSTGGTNNNPQEYQEVRYSPVPGDKGKRRVGMRVEKWYRRASLSNHIWLLAFMSISLAWRKKLSGKCLCMFRLLVRVKLQ